MKLLGLVCVLSISNIALWAQDQTLTFKSSDGLKMTADIYKSESAAGKWILLCHQAGWSRGEYRPTASWLAGLGYNLMAIDQRSGGGINDVPNQTHAAAMASGRATEYTDAKQDIEAALRYLRKQEKPSQLVLLGSSYSAALALRIAGEKLIPIDAVLAFSPGEYFDQKPYVAATAGEIDIPVFITSAKNEGSYWAPITAAIDKSLLRTYLPSQVKGHHGSRALWPDKDGYRGYRQATATFLAGLR